MIERPAVTRKTLPERIDDVLGGEPKSYAAVAHALWGADDRAWRHLSNGGPPGCYMALSAGIRRGGFYVDHAKGNGPGQRMVCPRAKAAR